MKEYFKELCARLERKVENISLLFGMSDISDTIFGIKKRFIQDAKRLYLMVKILFPNNNYLVYSDLGVFAWMDIQEDEIEIMLKDLKEIFNQDDNMELVETLKVYLDCKMNYSHTAKKLYIHINTVRKRIEHIKDRIHLDLENPLTRLKLEILLKLFN